MSSNTGRAIPLSVPNMGAAELEYIKKCIETNWVSSSGRFVSEFEKAVSRSVNSAHAVACVNGTSALYIALKLCGAGVDDEVIVPTLTFIAPVNVVKYAGAEPVFMDCDDHMNMDADKLREFCSNECVMVRSGLRNKKTGRIIKAVIPVHVFGNPCDMEEIMRVARRYRLKVIEDATESMGAYYGSGTYKNRFTGTIADAGVFSFNGNKIITTGGGGMIVTGNRLLSDRARYLTCQAKDDPVRHVHNEIGYNFRLTNMQAALGLAQLRRLKGFIATKRRNYYLYGKYLDGIRGAKLLDIPEGTVPNFWFYPLLVEKDLFGMSSDALALRLRSRGIETRPVWHLNHLQRPYRRNQSFRVEKALWFSRRVLNLPCSTNLSGDDVMYTVSEIRKIKQGY